MMTIKSDEWLGVYIPADLMEAIEIDNIFHLGGRSRWIHVLKVRETADYIWDNRDSELAKNVEEEGDIDIDDHRDIVSYIKWINRMMGKK